MSFDKKDLLRFVTLGSVDDGKSTMIGRLLYDCRLIMDDQLEAVKKVSKQRGYEDVDLSLLVDGLKAEREQGITIDVAYRYFETLKRKFIIIDSPGHIEYTRNMVTGASNANLALILVDARNGILEQTKRHSFIASLLKIPHIIVCINKMDLVNYKQEVFEKIKEDYSVFSSKLDVDDVQFIPISALNGDNLINKSENMTWYLGPTLFYLLENVYVLADRNMRDCRFPIQYAIRPRENNHLHDYRGYAGRIAGGIFKPGDKVVILPSGLKSKVKSIEMNGEKLQEAFPPMSVVMQLEDDVDISRGDMTVREHNRPIVSQDIDLMICWLSKDKLSLDKNYIVKHTTKEVKCAIKNILYKIDINTLHRIENDKKIGMNDIARIKIKTSAPLFFDSYNRNKITGSLIFIDEHTNNTVAAGMIK